LQSSARQGGEERLKVKVGDMVWLDLEQVNKGLGRLKPKERFLPVQVVNIDKRLFLCLPIFSFFIQVTTNAKFPAIRVAF